MKREVSVGPLRTSTSMSLRPCFAHVCPQHVVWVFWHCAEPEVTALISLLVFWQQTDVPFRLKWSRLNKQSRAPNNNIQPQHKVLVHLPPYAVALPSQTIKMAHGCNLPEAFQEKYFCYIVRPRTLYQIPFRSLCIVCATQLRGLRFLSELKHFCCVFRVVPSFRFATQMRQKKISFLKHLNNGTQLVRSNMRALQRPQKAVYHI